MSSAAVVIATLRVNQSAWVRLGETFGKYAHILKPVGLLKIPSCGRLHIDRRYIINIELYIIPFV